MVLCLSLSLSLSLFLCVWMYACRYFIIFTLNSTLEHAQRRWGVVCTYWTKHIVNYLQFSKQIFEKQSFVRIFIFYSSGLDQSKNLYFFFDKKISYSNISFLSNAFHKLLTSYIRRYSVVDVIERNTYCKLFCFLSFLFVYLFFLYLVWYQ
jgi:hypothetical protein